MPVVPVTVRYRHLFKNRKRQAEAKNSDGVLIGAVLCDILKGGCRIYG